MGASKLRAIKASRGAVLALAGLSLAACASTGPRYPVAGGYGGGARQGPETASNPPPSKYSGYRVGKPYEIDGRWYTPAEQPGYDEVGTASWYGEQFHNKYTADGEVFDMHIPTAAHKTLPLPSLVEVTNLANGRKMVVRVNDRGPFVGDRIIDMSREAATQLGFMGQGVTQVRVRYVGPAPDLPRVYPVSTDPNAIVAQPKPVRTRAPARTQVAAVPPPPPAVLGSDIEDRPVQAAPANLGWNSAPQPQPESRPVLQAVSTPAEPQGGLDLDSLLDQLSPPPAAPPPPAPVSSGRMVQAGAFSTRANAERAAASLGGETRIEPVEQSGRTLYRVLTAAR